jgi:hypothetical protein
MRDVALAVRTFVSFLRLGSGHGDVKIEIYFCGRESALGGSSTGMRLNDGARIVPTVVETRMRECDRCRRRLSILVISRLLRTATQTR